jgi:hypothetical protein
VLDCTQPTDISGDLDVVGRVGDDGLREFVAKQRCLGIIFQRTAAQD